MKHILERILKYHQMQIELENPLNPEESVEQYKETLASFYLDKQVHLFDFLLQLTSKEEPLKQTLDILRRVSTNSLPRYNTIQDLVLNTDLTEAKAWLEDELNSPEGLSKAQVFKEQFAKYLKLYPLVVWEICALTEELNAKVSQIAKVGDQVKQLESLPVNAALTGVLDSLKAYLAEVCKDFQVEEVYIKLIGAYQRLHVLQDVSKSVHATQNEHLVPLCMVCFTDPVDSTLTPCGHTFCKGCVKKTMAARTCFCCRTAIQGSQRIYFS